MEKPNRTAMLRRPKTGLFGFPVWLVWLHLVAVLTWPGNIALAVEAKLVGSGFNLPLYATSPPGDADRLFVLEQFATGSLTQANIKILDLNNCYTSGVCRTNSTPFLTVTGLRTHPNDFAFQGTQGFTFHPDYANNGLFYVSFIGAGLDTYVREYRVSPNDPNVADQEHVRNIITIDKKPGSRHNSAWLGFGPNDGYLYMTVGDSGGENDPHLLAQYIGDLNAKVLRLDVDGVDAFPDDPLRNYAIPPSNPFVGRAGADEIWAYGLRNPWRASFDRETGDFYLGDVGANAREEVNVQPANHPGGSNYGWRVREGMIATPGVGGLLSNTMTDPIYDYTHGNGNDQGFSVTGGYVYRGAAEQLQGTYFFADYTNERVWSLDWDGSDPRSYDGKNFTNFVDHTTDLVTGGSVDQIVSFAEDGAGELYILDLGAGQTGQVFKILPPGPDRIWAANRSGVWHENANWSGGGQPKFIGTSATFGAAISRPRTVATDVDVTVSSIVFDNVNEYVLAGVGDLILESESGTATVHAVKGSHRFQLDVRINSDANVSTTGTSRITFHGPLILGGNTLTITSGSNVSINNSVSTGGGSIMNFGMLSGSGSIDGNLTSVGTLAFKLEEGDNGDLPSPLHVTGDVLLAGSVSVSLAKEFTLAAGEEFTVLTADGSLSVEDLQLSGPHARMFRAPILQGDCLTLKVVPEVSAQMLAVLSVGCLGTLLRRRYGRTTGRVWSGSELYGSEL